MESGSFALQGQASCMMEHCGCFQGTLDPQDLALSPYISKSKLGLGEEPKLEESGRVPLHSPLCNVSIWVLRVPTMAVR